MSRSENWTKSQIPLKWVEGSQFQGSSPILEDYFEVNPSRGIFILADGFGGGAGQKVAEIAVKSVRQFLEQEAGDLDATLPFELRSYYSLAGNVLFNAIAYANQKIYQFNQDKTPMHRGGASLIAGYIEGRLLSVANVGAVQLFLHRDGQTKSLVTPRTLARQTDPFSEESSLGSQVPLMSLGTAKQMEPEVSEIELKAGDQVCFQTGMVDSNLRSQLFQLNASGDHLKQWTHWLDTAKANLSQGTNSSVIWAAF
jgi:serine/threonine protein phosphatase PrpC